VPRLAASLVLLLAIAVAAGCGSSSEDTGDSPTAPIGATAKSCETEAVDAEGLSVSGVSCEAGRQVMDEWQRSEACAPPTGASRVGCDAGSFRCASVYSERGLAVSCARPGHSVAFITQRR